MTVEFAPSGRVHVRACASRVYSAIDDAATRIEEAVNRRAARLLSS
ncbi:MAG: HPF/RaiA family ribosome-associated protein [Vicinamibacterales bacterium]